MEQLQKRGQQIYTWLNEHTGGLLGLLRDAIERFGESQGSLAAAGMAYYAFLSLFPLMVALIAAGSFFLRQEAIKEQVINLIREAIPVSQGLIDRNLDRILELRGPVGLLGLAGALWSASGFFAVLARNVNQAWPKAEERGFFRQRLAALLMILGLTIPLILSFVASPALQLLADLKIPLDGTATIYQTALWTILSNLIPWLITVLLFTALYRWTPNTPVNWGSAFGGAVIAALAWEVTNYGFSLYLSSGLARYEIVFGSLATIAILLLWVYLTNLILLFGAHLSAAIDRWRRTRTPGSPS